MTGNEREAADWVLAVLTATVWCSTYVVFFRRDPAVRRWWHVQVWRVRQRLRRRGNGSRPAPMALAPRPPSRAMAAPTRRATSPVLPAGRTATARKVEVAEPTRIAEWSVDNLPLRYRLLGRVRRVANEN